MSHWSTALPRRFARSGAVAIAEKAPSSGMRPGELNNIERRQPGSGQSCSPPDLDAVVSHQRPGRRGARPAEIDTWRETRVDIIGGKWMSQPGHRGDSQVP